MSRKTELYLKDQIQGLVNKLNEASFNPFMQTPFDSKMYKEMLITKDSVLCSNRYFWDQLLEMTNLSSQRLEALLYWKGSICAFNNNGRLQFADFTDNGTLDPYGQLSEITPIDFGGHTYGRKCKVINAIGEMAKDDSDVAIVIHDYTPQGLSSRCISRSVINAATTIKDQVNVYAQLSNNIALSVKKAIAICENEDQRNAVINQIKNIFETASPIIALAKSTKKGKSVLDGVLEMFNFNNNFDTQNYCQQIDYYDKVRRSFNGVPAPDTFEKKERKLTAETEDTTTHTELVLLDGYMQRFLSLQLMKKYLKIEGIESLNITYNAILDPSNQDDGSDDDVEEEKPEEEGVENE